MTAHDWFIEHRTEYAARALDAAEMVVFEEHVARCDSCRVAVERIEVELRWLPMGVSPVPVRPGLHRQILDHAIGRAPSRLRRWSLPIGIAASLLTGVAGWQLGRSSAPVSVVPPVVQSLTPSAVVPPELVARVSALEDTLSIMRQAARVMQAKITMHGREGGMVIFDDARTHRWNVVVHGLAAAPANEGYQFWFICSDGMVRGARVSVDPATPMLFTTGMPAPSCKVIGAALTMESAKNSDGPPRGKELAHILM
jgi:hypothetical protein